MNRAALRTEIEHRLAGFDCELLAEELIRAGVPCGPVRNVSEVMSHPHTLHREMVVEMGEYRGLGSPIKLSRTPATYRLMPPRFAEHMRAQLLAIGIEPELYSDALPGSAKV
jgi:formyl-CoA transferase